MASASSHSSTGGDLYIIRIMKAIAAPDLCADVPVQRLKRTPEACLYERSSAGGGTPSSRTFVFRQITVEAPQQYPASVEAERGLFALELENG